VCAMSKSGPEGSEEKFGDAGMVGEDLAEGDGDDSLEDEDEADEVDDSGRESSLPKYEEGLESNAGVATRERVR
jgi:hypothetical protein